MQVREIKLSAQKATKGKGQKEQVITRIVERFNSRSKKDLKDWRKALDAGENLTRPNRVPYYNLCDEVEIDLHLTAVMQHGVIDKLLSEEYRIVDESGTIDKELTDFFKGHWFYEFCSLALEAEFKGHSLIQVGDIVEVNGRKTIQEIVLIPRRHVKPEYGEIVTDQNDERGYPYRNDENMMYWLVEAGSHRELGLFKKLAPIVLFKKNCMSAWSEYCEIFGMPTRVGKTNSRDKKDLDRMEESLQKAGKAAYAMLQDGESFEFIESTKGDAFNVYDKLIERCNSEISKAVVGSTLTTDTAPNGNRSLGDVHLQSSDNIMETRKRFITAVVRDRLMPLLERRGLKTAGRIFEYNEKKDLNELYTRTKGFIDSGMFTVEPQWAMDTFGIPLTVVEQTPANEPNPGAKPKPEKKKLSKDASFIDSLYQDCLCCSAPSLKLSASAQSELSSATDKLISLLWKKEDIQFNHEVFLAFSNILTDGLVAGWLGKKKLELSYRNTTDFSIVYDSPDWQTITMMEANLFKFSAAKTLSMVNELNQLLPDSKTFGDFQQKAAKVVDEYSLRTLRTEYNFAWQTAQNAAEYHRMVSEKDVYPYWQYITAGDSRVRPAHSKLDKLTFKADDPAFNTIYPPNGWNCRCYVKPIRKYPEDKLSSESDALDALAKTEVDAKGTSELDRMKKNGMNVNRAKEGIIFTQNQLYVKELEANIGIKDNGVKPYKDIDTDSLPSINIQERDKSFAQKWYNENVVDGVITDYANRPLQFTEDTLERHLKGKYLKEGRQSIIEFMPDILNSPDEVYLFKDGANGTFKYRYLKFYQEKPLTVVASFAEGKMSIDSWYDLEDKAGTRAMDDNVRTGFLIKK